MTWSIIIYKISGFMTATCFISVGAYIAYYRDSVKVDSILQVLKTSFYALWGFGIFGGIHTAFVILYAVLVDI